MRVEDLDGNELIGFNFGEVQRGDITDKVPIVLNNDRNYDSNGIIVKADVSLINHRGLTDDTLESTFISLDGVNGLLEQVINIPANTKRVIYLHYQPTYLAEPSNYQWCLLVKEANY